MPRRGNNVKEGYRFKKRASDTLSNKEKVTENKNLNLGADCPVQARLNKKYSKTKNFHHTRRFDTSLDRLVHQIIDNHSRSSSLSISEHAVLDMGSSPPPYHLSQGSNVTVGTSKSPQIISSLDDTKKKKSQKTPGFRKPGMTYTQLKQRDLKKKGMFPRSFQSLQAQIPLHLDNRVEHNSFTDDPYPTVSEKEALNSLEEGNTPPNLEMEQDVDLVDPRKKSCSQNSSLPTQNKTNDLCNSTAYEEDFDDLENERDGEYCTGGYHPVRLGELYNERYRIVKKLGWGCFSTVWLVWDYEAQEYYAMKIQKSAVNFHMAAMDEIRILARIQDAASSTDTFCSHLVDFFEVTGPHGIHVCMVFELLGENLLSLIRMYHFKGIPLPIVKCLTWEILSALEYLHSINIIHTDVKPENILLSKPSHKIISVIKRYKPPPRWFRIPFELKDPKIMTKSQKRRYYKKLKKLKDKKNLSLATENSGSPSKTTSNDSSSKSGNVNNTHDSLSKEAQDWLDSILSTTHNSESETDEEFEIERIQHCHLADFGNSCLRDLHFSEEIQTRQYRSPEVIIGAGYDTSSDIWSLACVVFELITGDFLFSPVEGKNFSRDEDHLTQISELLGKFPDKYRFGSPNSKESKYFDANGQFRHIKNLKHWSLEDVFRVKYSFSSKKAAELTEFLSPMLELDADQRATATEMLDNFCYFFDIHEDDFSPYQQNDPEFVNGEPTSKFDLGENLRSVSSTL